jgi:maltokinase
VSDRRRPRDLEARAASTGSAEFLPVRLAADRQEPLGDPSLLDALDLGRGRWVLVLETKPGLLTSAVVEELEGFRRARAGDGVSEGLLAKTASSEGRGSFTFRRLGTIGPWSGERPIEVDQSNESVVVGDAAVVKRFVFTTVGNERPRVLPAHLAAAGFEEMPAPLGSTGWQHTDGAMSLASITTYLPDARDGWDWYVELLERSIEDRSFDAVEPAAALGALTAGLHAALATPTDVLPAPTAAAGSDTVAAWRRSAEADLESALSSIDGGEGSRLRERAAAIREELDELRIPETVAIPIHGDLHVGQFLRWRGGLVVSDLDGDPLGPGTLMGSPAKDVASLMQSLDHVGRIVERRRGSSLTQWIRDVSDACAEAYRGELAALDASALFDEQLLRPLRVAQELHEFVYAARYLPTWRYVPDRALPALLEERRT